LSPLRCTIRYILGSEDGFLTANTGQEAIAVEAVPDPFAAVRFADLDVAAQRARALLKLGWANLRIVTLYVPLP
jgi:hypothetical protein